MGAAGAFMGGLGSLMGGKSKSTSTSSSSSDSSSQNSNVQGSSSNNASSNASGSANQAYGSLNQALSPTLGYTANAGQMIGALLGLPSNNFYSTAPATSVLPKMPKPSSGASGSGHGSMVDQLIADYKAQAAAPASAPAPGTSVPVTPTATGGYTPTSSGNPGAFGSDFRMQRLADLADRREMGGPVQAGKPYVVGEKQPELFVPHTSGTIVPQVPRHGPPGVGGMMDKMFDRHGGHGGRGGLPGTPGLPGNTGIVPPPAPAPTPWTPSPAPSAGGALDAFANSAGQQFVLGEGQRAISGQNAAGGTLQSGATGKALVNYGQNLGKTYLNDYMNHLFDYAKLGLGSSSALSGAGGVSQSVGSSSGGSNSFGYGSGSSTSTSDMDSTSKSKSKQGLGI